MMHEYHNRCHQSQNSKYEVKKMEYAMQGAEKIPGVWCDVTPSVFREGVKNMQRGGADQFHLFWGF